MKSVWKRVVVGGGVETYILPPRSLICNVTIASAIHIMANTPLKTSERWSSRAFKLSRKDSSRQKRSGPL